MASRSVVTRPLTEPDVEILNRRGRDRILAAALEEFADRGFDGTTTAEIARRSGVTQPLVHYHFSTKEALWRAAVSDAFAGVLDVFADVPGELADLGVIDQMKVLVRRFVRFSAAHPEMARIISNEGVRGGPRLDWLLEHHMAGRFEWFGLLFEQAVSEGAIKDLRREFVITSLTAACAYMFMIRTAMADGYGIDVEDPAEVEAHADTVVELFFHGLVDAPRVGAAARAGAA